MPGSSEARGCQVLLTGGLVVDGTGAPPFPGRVGIRGDTICLVERAEVPPPDAPATVDCTGLVLTPGFLDIHTHSDLSFLLDPLASSKLIQGVTTEVVGNCGFSPFPATPARRGELAEFLRGLGTPRTDLDWTDFDGYAEAVQARTPVMNLAPLVGHGALRIAVAGTGDVPAGPQLLRPMAQALHASLDQGAFGLSTGLT